MTKLGKIFVLVNLTFSVTMLAWAVALFANRIDWSDKGEGELKKRIDKIKDLQAALPQAQTTWRDARANVMRVEARRPADRAWYGQQLQAVRIRTGAEANRPSQSIVFDRGVPALDATGRPQLADATGPMNQPLLSLDFYQREMKTVLDDTAAQTARYEKAIKDDIDETNNLIRIREQLVRERQKYADLVREQEIVRPQLINAFVESQLILRRADALKERIRELEGVGVARGK